LRTNKTAVPDTFGHSSAKTSDTMCSTEQIYRYSEDGQFASQNFPKNQENRLNSPETTPNPKGKSQTTTCGKTVDNLTERRRQDTEKRDN
jgi:hypothetical protein